MRMMMPTRPMILASEGLNAVTIIIMSPVKLCMLHVHPSSSSSVQKVRGVSCTSTMIMTSVGMTAMSIKDIDDNDDDADANDDDDNDHVDVVIV
eukprot:7237092-Karenia_brevis.AAC.1